MRLKKFKITPKYLLFFLFTFNCIPLNTLANRYNEQVLREYIEHTKKYSFSADWFSYNIATWERILSQYKNSPNIKYLEIGVFEGRSLIWMLENILTHPTARAIGIENFMWDTEEKLRANLKISGFSKKVKIIKGLSQNVIKHLQPNYFDIIYVDGSHIAPNVLSDAILSWPLLKNEGLIIFDDYLWDMHRPEELRPKIAIDAFISVYRNDIEIVIQEYQVILKKVKTNYDLENSYPIGQYAYSWWKRKLYRDGTNEEIILSDKERMLVEQLINSKKFRDIKFNLDNSILKDEVFVNLTKRLNLGLGENKKQ